MSVFLSRALATYTVDTKIAIGFWSHGTGIYGESNYQQKEIILTTLKDNKIASRNALDIAEENKINAIENITRRSCEYSSIRSDSYKDELTIRESNYLLQSSLNKKIDMIFFDFCLNGMAEVMHELAEYAEVIVASTDLEPRDGWDYKRWFEKMASAPPVDSVSWAKQAVAAFEESYKYKTDLHPCTLGAFATTNNILVQAFKTLIEAIDVHGTTGWHWMNDARGRTQSFSGYATYDLFHFTQNLLIVLEKYGVNAEKVKEKAQALADAFQKCRVHSVALGEKVRNSHGLGFWFPYEQAIFMKDVESYSGLSFDKDTGWTSYLKKHYLVE